MFRGIPADAWVGEGSVITREPRRDDIVALAPSRTIHIPRAAFRWLLEATFEVNHFITDQLNERLGRSWPCDVCFGREIDRAGKSTYVKGAQGAAGSAAYLLSGPGGTPSSLFELGPAAIRSPPRRRLQHCPLARAALRRWELAGAQRRRRPGANGVMSMANPIAL